MRFGIRVEAAGGSTMAPEQAQQEAGPQRNDLTGEHPVGDKGQLVLALLFLATWAADIWLAYTTFLNQVVPTEIRVPLGAIMLAVSGYLAWMGLSTVFGRRRRERPGVIRKGVFGRGGGRAEIDQRGTLRRAHIGDGWDEPIRWSAEEDERWMKTT
jgi:hypothetical protein